MSQFQNKHINVVIDIETVENDIFSTKINEIEFKPDSRLKDPAKIEQSILNKRQKAFEQAALYWWSGKTICICANVIGHDQVKPKTFYGDNERNILILFFDMLEKLYEADSELRILGKSSVEFDKPFIIGRALVHDIGIPRALRPYRPIEDVDQIFGFSARCSQISNLNNYALGLGIKPKTASGEGVKDMYLKTKMGDKNGWKEIINYCAHDTDIPTHMLKRYFKDYVPSYKNAPVVKGEAIPADKSDPPPTRPFNEDVEIPFGG